MTTAVLVYDHGPGAGMGHQRRMTALGTALAAYGCRCLMVPSDSEPIETEIVVLDSYRFRVDEPGRFKGSILAALDDLDRDLACDLVIDPNPGAVPNAHRAARKALIGARYALVDPALSLLHPRPVGMAVETALVASGANDRRLAGPRMATALARLLPGVEVRLALGPWTEGSAPGGVVAVQTETGLGPALAQADVVVTGAGVTLLEALALGRPTVTVVLADNQLQAARGAEEAGAALRAGVSDAPALAASLAGDAALRRSLSSAARAMVDGAGPRRVARALLELTR